MSLCVFKKIRRPFRLLLRLIIRTILFFVLGFVWIQTDKSRVSKNDNHQRKARVIIGNHPAIYDAFILYWLHAPVFVAKEELGKIPFVGRIVKAAGVYVIFCHFLFFFCFYFLFLFVPFFFCICK